ncbi:MAG: hypothetical protein KTR31_11655 [Myxococcales bacterium]|nr:hypothetical protein [Myxococcales bacterium]
MAGFPPPEEWTAHVGGEHPAGVAPPGTVLREEPPRTSDEALQDVEYDVDPEGFEVVFTGKPPPLGALGLGSALLVVFVAVAVFGPPLDRHLGLHLLAALLWTGAFGTLPGLTLALAAHRLALTLRPVTRVEVTQHQLRITPAHGPRVDLAVERLRTMNRAAGILFLRTEDRLVEIPVGADPADAVDAVVAHLGELHERNQGRAPDAEEVARSQEALAALQEQLTASSRRPSGIDTSTPCGTG